MGKYRKYLPYRFTEQGITMLSGLLRSKVGILVSIQIINAFVEMRKVLTSYMRVFQRIENVEVKQLDGNKNFEKIFNYMLLNKPKQGIFFN